MRKLVYIVEGKEVATMKEAKNSGKNYTVRLDEVDEEKKINATLRDKRAAAIRKKGH